MAARQSRTRPAPPPADDDENDIAPVTAVRGGEVFDLDAAVADAMEDVWAFRYQGDGASQVEWHLAHPGTVDYRDAEAADGGDADAVRRVLEAAMTAAEDDQGDAWIEFDELNMPALGLDKLFRAWLEHFGIKPGELQGSAGRYGATAGPSNRASRRGSRNSGNSSRRAGGGSSRR